MEKFLKQLYTNERNKFLFIWLILFVAFQQTLFAQATYQGAKSNNGLTRTMTVAKPDNLAIGDLLIITIGFESGSGVAISTVPSGWNLIKRRDQSSNFGVAVYWKIASATETEAANYEFRLDQDKKWSMGVSRITGHHPTSPIAVGTDDTNWTISSSSNTSIIAPAVTTTAANQLVLSVFSVKKSATFGSYTSGLTERYDVAADPPSHALASYVQVTAGATGTKQATSSQSETWIAGQIVIASAPAPPTAANTTITANPTSITANGTSTSTITVQLKNADGNNVTTNAGTILLNTTAGTLSAVTYTSNGAYTATLTSPTATGSATVTGTLNGTAITSSATVTFTPGAASGSRSLIEVSPESVSANGTATGTITVTLKDANGNNITTGGATVTLNSSLNLGTGSISAVTDNGNGTYTATIRSTNAGIATITGTVNGSSITGTVTFNAVSLTNIADPARTTIDVLPASIVANGTSTANILVQLKDSQGLDLEISDTENKVVTLEIDPALGTISNLQNQNNGTWTATLTSGTVAGLAVITGKLGGTSITDTANATLTAGPAAKLSITTQLASSYVSMSAISMTVEVLDANDNLVSTATNPVTITLNNNPASGTLSGTLVQNAVNGVVTFSNIKIDKVGTGYTLNAAASGLTSVVSNAFNITIGAADATQSTITASPTSGLDANGSATSFVTVTVKDAGGNVITVPQAVFFTTNLGSLGSTGGNTTSGSFVNTLTSSTTGTATVTAYLGSNASAPIIGTASVGFSTPLTSTDAPRANWNQQSSRTDYFNPTGTYSGAGPFYGQSGPVSQHGMLAQSYNADLYENLNYSGGSPGKSDIKSLNLGFDNQFYYFKISLVDLPDAGGSNKYYLEIDTDGLTGGDKWSDYFISYEGIPEHVGTTWRAEGKSKVKVYVPKSGFTNSLKIECNEIDFSSNGAYVRINNTDKTVEIAVRRSVLNSTSNASIARGRAWSTQTSTLDGKLPWNEWFPSSDLGGKGFDNTDGSNQDTWPEFGPGVVKYLTITAQPGDVQCGQLPQQPTVQLRNLYNEIINKSGVEVTAAIYAGSGTLLGTIKVNTDNNGLATFTDLGIDGQAGQYRLEFSIDNDDVAPVVSNVFNLLADTEGPTITLDESIVAGVMTISADEGECSAELTLEDLFSVSDNCDDIEDLTVVIEIDGEEVTGSYTFTETTTVNVKVTDLSGNESTETFEVVVEDTEDPIITLGSSFVEGVLTVSADEGECSAELTLEDLFSVSDNCDDIEDLTVLIEIDGEEVTGSYTFTETTTVNVKVTDLSGNESTDSFNITIDEGTCLVCEIEDAVYGGIHFASTATTKTYDALVQLAATIRLVEGKSPASQKVRFVNLDADPASGSYYLTGWLTPQPIVGFPLLGSVSAQVSFNIGSMDSQQYRIGLIGEGCGQLGEDALITVSKPLDDFVTGGGYLLETKSAGKYTADKGSKINFGFNVKFNKTKTTLQGNTNIIFRKDGKVYRIKANNFTSLSAANATSKSPAQATYSARASLFDSTDPEREVSIASQKNLVVVMTDRTTADAKENSMDDLSFTLWDSDGSLLFSSSWESGKTVQQRLTKGNVQVNQNNNVNGKVANNILLTSDDPDHISPEGQLITFFAFVEESDAAIPTGTITFLSGNTVLGYVPIAGNTVSFKVNNLTIGTHGIWAYYSGDSRFAPSSTDENGLFHTVIQKTEEPKTETPIVQEPVSPTKGGGGKKSSNLRVIENEAENQAENKAAAQLEIKSEEQTEAKSESDAFNFPETISAMPYPNPSNGNYTISLIGFDNSGINAEVYSSQGKLIRSIPVDYNSQTRKFSVDISDQPAGLYYLHISQGLIKTMVRLVKN